MCESMVDIQCPTADIRRGNKKRRKKKPPDENMYVRILLCRAAINDTCTTASKSQRNATAAWNDVRSIARRDEFLLPFENDTGSLRAITRPHIVAITRRGVLLQTE